MDIIHIQHPDTFAHSAVAEPCVMALGFFDGVHLGHQRLIAKAKEVAQQKRLKLSVMTFFPHPKQIVHQDETRVRYITPLAKKARKLEELGVDQIIVVKFDAAFASLPSSQFVKQYLFGLQCKHAVAGFDFHYGYKGQGDIESLKRDGEGGFEVTELEKFELNHEKVSSTFIRSLIAKGKVSEVPTYLGTWYESQGIVRTTTFHQNCSYFHVTVSEGYLPIPEGEYEIEVFVNDTMYSGIAQQHNHSQDLFVIRINDSVRYLEGEQITIEWKKQVSKKLKWSTNIQDKELPLII